MGVNWNLVTELEILKVFLGVFEGYPWGHFWIFLKYVLVSLNFFGGVIFGILLEYFCVFLRYLFGTL